MNFWRKDRTSDLRHLLTLVEGIMVDVSKLSAAVAAQTTVVADVVKMLTAASDPAAQVAVDAAATQVEGNTAALTAASTHPVAPPAS